MTQNKIATTYRESVEEFGEFEKGNKYPWLKGGAAERIKSHHKHTALELLRAVREGMSADEPTNGALENGTNKEIEGFFRNGDIGTIAEHYRKVGRNTAKAEVRELIDGAIKEIGMSDMAHSQNCKCKDCGGDIDFDEILQDLTQQKCKHCGINLWKAKQSKDYHDDALCVD